jgi:cell division protein FtsB
MNQNSWRTIMEERKKSIAIFFFYFIIILIVISAAVMVLPVYRQFKLREEKVAQLRIQTALKTAESMRLHQEVSDLTRDPRAIEKVAREKFGLCRKGELIMEYNPAPTNTNK